jgi:glucan phosphorylase
MNRCRFRRAASAFSRATTQNPRATSASAFVGIGLFYREGYFQQAIDSNNWQTEYYNPVDPHNIPLEPVLDGGRRARDLAAWRSA